MPSDTEHSASDDRPGKAVRQSWLRRIGRGAAWLAAAVACVPMIVLLALEFDGVLERTGRWAIGRFSPFVQAELTVGRISGGVVSGLHAQDIRLTHASGDTLVSVSELSGQIGLLPLLSGRLSFSEVRVARPEVRMSQGPDSSWDLASVLPPSDTTDQDATVISVRDVRLTDGRLTASFFPSDADSSLRMFDISMRLDHYSSEPTAVNLDSLGLRLTPPGAADTVEVRIAGDFVDGALHVRRLDLDSERSRVEGRGRLAFTGSDRNFEDLDFRLEAAPLSFRDIFVFVPGLRPEATATAEVRITGSSNLVSVATDVSFGDGSSVTVEGEVSPPSASRQRYDLAARIRGVDPDYLATRLGGTASRLDADLEVDLEGPRRSELSGVARLAVEPAAFRNVEIGPTSVTANLDGGRLDLTGNSSLNGTDVQVQAGGQPLGETPSYLATVSVAGFDVSRFQSGSGVTSDLNARLVADLRGRDVESLTGTLSVQVDSSRWSALFLPEARARMSIREGVIDAVVTGTTGTGTFNGEGSITVSEPVTYSITRLDLRDVDLAAIGSDTTSSSVSGSLSGSGRGTDPRTLRARAELRVDTTRYGTYEVRSAAATFNVSSGRVEIDATADMRGGRISVEGTARPFATRPSFDISAARFDSLNYAELTGEPLWETLLAGSVTGRLELYDGRATGNLEAHLEASRVNEQPIDAADLVARVRNETLDVDLDIEIPGGQVAFAANGRPFADQPEIEITGGTLRGIDISRIAGIPEARTDLNGSFTGRIRGFEPDSATAEVHLELERSVVNLDTVRAATLSFAADSGRATVEAEIALTRGSAALNGSARLSGSRHFEVEGSMADLSPTRLAGIDSVASAITMEFAVSGEALTDTPTVSGSIDVLPSSLGGIELEQGRVRLGVSGGTLVLDTLTVTSSAGRISGGGTLVISADSTSPASNLSLHADLTDASKITALLPLESRLLADGTLSLSIMGAPASRRVRLDGDLRRIAYGSVRIGEMRVRVVGQLGDGFEIRDAEGRLEAEQPSLPNIAARSARLDAAYRDSELRFEFASVVDDRRDVRGAGTLALEQPEPTLTLNTLRFGSEKERWQLLTTSEVTFGDEYRVSNLLLYSDRQQIAVDGFIDLDGEQSLVLTIEEARIGPVAKLFGYDGLDGRVNGYVDLTGRADAPRITGSISADLSSLERHVGDLSADLDYSDRRLEIDATIRDRDDNTLTLRGYAPVDLRLSPSDTTGSAAQPRLGGAGGSGQTSLTVSADSFAIDWVKPFLDPLVYSDIAGRLSGQVEVRGTFADPGLEGSAMITDGLLGLRELDVAYRNIRVDARFVDDRILVDHLEATSGSGSVIATGTINLDELNLGSFDIDISTEDFLAVDNRQYRAIVGADLRLTGTTRRPDLEGTIDVASADIYLVEEIEEFEPVRLSEQDLLTVEQRFGIRLTERDTTTFVFYEALAMDLTVTMRRNTWLRSSKNPTMDIQFTGSLDVSKRPYENQEVFGTIEVLPERSKIVQFGKAFEIRKGTLTFNGPVDDPILDIDAQYSISAWRNPDAEVTITLSASGRLEDLDVELSSDPAMELTDIVSYIALGRPASESLHLGGGSEGGGSLATNIALGQVASVIENVAGSNLGLDVVEIEQQGLDTRLTAGKYVTSRLYLSISQPLSLSNSTSASTFGNKREITVEYEMLQSLLLRLLSRRGSISVNLLWQYAY